MIKDEMEVEILGQVMTCPYCNFAYIEQVAVELWFREEDAVDGIHFFATKDASFFDKHATDGNPSARRQATAIVFKCEECSGISMLAISQHKGQTLARWHSYQKGGE